MKRSKQLTVKNTIRSGKIKASRKRLIVYVSIFIAVGIGNVVVLDSIREPMISNQPIVKSRMALPRTQPRSNLTGSMDGQSGPSGNRLPVSLPTGAAVRQGQIPIIMYHYIRVNDPDDAKGASLSVTPEHFAQQLDDLRRRGYQTVTFRDLVNGRMPTQPIILTFDDGYEDFYTTAWPELTRRGMTAVVYVIADFQKSEYLTAEQILMLANNGIEIGSHTLDHALLTKATTQDAERQLIVSRRRLEAMTGQPVVSLAYPFGGYTVAIARDAAQAGYLYAVTTAGGLADLAQPMELNRFRAKDEPVLKLDGTSQTDVNNDL